MFPTNEDNSDDSGIDLIVGESEYYRANSKNILIPRMNNEMFEYLFIGGILDLNLLQRVHFIEPTFDAQVFNNICQEYPQTAFTTSGVEIQTIHLSNTSTYASGSELLPLIHNLNVQHYEILENFNILYYGLLHNATHIKGLTMNNNIPDTRFIKMNNIISLELGCREYLNITKLIEFKNLKTIYIKYLDNSYSTSELLEFFVGDGFIGNLSSLEEISLGEEMYPYIQVILKGLPSKNLKFVSISVAGQIDEAISIY